MSSDPTAGRGHLIATVGIPASGKTTWAESRAAVNGAVRVISRDDIRAKLFEPGYLVNTNDPAREATVTAAQNAATRGALEHGLTVIVADTNLDIEYLRAWQRLVDELGGSFEVRLFDIPLAEAQRRNAARARRLPADVLVEMHERWKVLVPQLANLGAPILSGTGQN